MYKIKELNKYDEQAKDFCEKYGIKVFKIQSAIQTPPEWAKDGKYGIKYDVKICRYDKNKFPEPEYIRAGDVERMAGFTFNFWDSIANKEGKRRHPLSHLKRPTDYVILSCLQNYDIGDIWDFIADFGYKANKETEKVYRAVVEEWEKVNAFFTAEELEELREIV